MTTTMKKLRPGASYVMRADLRIYGLPAITADRAGKRVDVGVEVWRCGGYELGRQPRGFRQAGRG